MDNSIIYTQHFKQWFGDWENNPEESSQCTNHDGTPMVVAHSTNANFSKFKYTQKNDTGWLGKGFYFFGDRTLDGQYGKNVMECYLNIRDPYYITYEEVEELSEANDPNISAEFTEKLIEDGYDGVYFNGNLNQEYCVFNPDQIWILNNPPQESSRMKLTENDIRQIVNEVIKRIGYNGHLREDMTRGQVESAFEDFMKDKAFEKRVNNIVVDVVSDFLESMWTKKSFWKTMLKKK